MIYLREFENINQYSAYTASTDFVAPNVSYIPGLQAGEKVKYIKNKPTPTPTHDYVEIGGIKWATMNIGANSVTDKGLYFQWGDTQGYTASQCGDEDGKKYFGCNDYKYNYYTEGDCMLDDKYNVYDELLFLEAEDDAVTAAWGNNWRMPTKNELDNLISATTSAWTNSYQGSGVAGVVLTDKTDNTKTLFFPEAGRLTMGYVAQSGIFYWLNQIDENGFGSDDAFSFSNDGYESNSRYHGFTVRGIWADN